MLNISVYVNWNDVMQDSLDLDFLLSALITASRCMRLPAHSVKQILTSLTVASYTGEMYIMKRENHPICAVVVCWGQK